MSPVKPLFEPAAGGIYNYAPSVLQLTDTNRVAYYCTNTRARVIRDSIGYREATLVDVEWELGDEQIVLDPAASDWDDIHVCDPSVVAGEFRDGEVTYSYALFYLGCDTSNVTHNQVGVAFAVGPAGPFHKWEANPVAPYEAYDRWWGTGQPSAVNVDRRGRIMLLYTRGDGDGTRVVARELNLSDLSDAEIGDEFEVTPAGLTSGDGSRPIFHNAEFAALPDGGFVMVRSRHPFDSEAPAYIASEVQVATLPGGPEGLRTGTWEVIANLGPAQTGWPRNHNAGIVRDPYGHVAGIADLEISLSLSQLGGGSLWTYRIATVPGR